MYTNTPWKMVGKPDKSNNAHDDEYKNIIAAVETLKKSKIKNISLGEFCNVYKVTDDHIRIDLKL